MDTAGRNGELTRWSRPVTCAQSIRGVIHLRHTKIHYGQAMRFYTTLYAFTYYVEGGSFCRCQKNFILFHEEPVLQNTMTHKGSKRNLFFYQTFLSVQQLSPNMKYLISDIQFYANDVDIMYI